MALDLFCHDLRDRVTLLVHAVFYCKKTAKMQTHWWPSLSHGRTHWRHSKSKWRSIFWLMLALSIFLRRPHVFNANMCTIVHSCVPGCWYFATWQLLVAYLTPPKKQALAFLDWQWGRNERRWQGLQRTTPGRG